jgi:hypothetical protein
MTIITLDLFMCPPGIMDFGWPVLLVCGAIVPRTLLKILLANSRRHIRFREPGNWFSKLIEDLLDISELDGMRVAARG